MQHVNGQWQPYREPAMPHRICPFRRYRDDQGYGRMNVLCTMASRQEIATESSMNNREQEVAKAAFDHWHQRAVTRTHDICTMNALLLSMGEHVKTVNEFFEHFASGRVVVQAHADSDDYRRGHSSFYYRNGTYEMLKGDDSSVSTRYKAKYARFHYPGCGTTPNLRSYIAHVHIPEEHREFWRDAYEGKMRHMIDVRRHLFVLNQRYSEQFTRAFEQERFSFIHQPQSYGLRYNCHRFVVEVLKRLLNLSHQ